MSNNPKKTSPKVARLASKTLSGSDSSNIAQKLAASTLSQTNTNKQTGAKIETLASKVLQSEKYSEETKALAASALSQSNKLR